MADQEELTFFERRLMAELEEIERQLKSLESDKRTLQRQLAKARAERTGLEGATRKNSMNRALAESSVIQMLKDEGKPVTTARLFRNACISNYTLKENTFRTYLHRMKKKGLIKTAGHVGTWTLGDGAQVTKLG